MAKRCPRFWRLGKVAFAEAREGKYGGRLILDQLPLRAIDRWFSISAHHSHSAQPTVLRGANRRMWFRKENRFLCVVVQRRDQSRGPVTQVGDKITNQEAVYNPAR